jgi:hypothetical protein
LKAVTALSCLALGLAFAIAVALLFLAGVAIGCLLPRRLGLRRRRDEPPPPEGVPDRR